MVILFVLKTVANWLVPIISSLKYKGVLGIIKDDIILIYIKKRNENILLLFFCKHGSYIVYYINANKTGLNPFTHFLYLFPTNFNTKTVGFNFFHHVFLF